MFTEMDKEKVKELRYQLILGGSNIAKRELVTEYKCRNKTIQAILLNVKQWISQGRSLYLHGSVGTGKTISGVAILKQYAKKLSEESVFQETPIFYISLPEFLNECKRDISRVKDDLVTPLLISKLKNADIVFLDEISAIKDLSAYEKNTLSAYERSILFEIIDQRTREMQATIYASNSNPQSLKNALGDPLYSRVYTASDKIEMNGGDCRGV
ncbi:MAG: AAA family ATPase [Clostridiales bacterium]|jgi:DNA replication protein DnaC|nr:AAA family ATPase [Clostridiales bacterium]